MKKVKKILTNIRINNLKKKGYNYFTITENGVVTQMLFYR